VVTGGELGRLVPFGNAAALAGAVAELAQAPRVRAEMGIAGRASVRERFHAARLINDISALYWQLLRNGGTIAGPSL
jgi:glycosyltransferase involved in cell wall biosynthesis